MISHVRTRSPEACRARFHALDPPSFGRIAGGARHLRRLALFAALWLACSGFSCPGAAPVCSVCGRTIQGKYLKAAGGPFCSRTCFERTLPKCSICARPISGEYLRHQGKKYCSERCFRKVLPKCEICAVPLRRVTIIDGHRFCEKHAKGPACLHCGLPFRKGVKLADGRRVCAACRPRLIFGRRPAEARFREAVEAVEDVTGYRSATLPPFRLVGVDELPPRNGRNPGERTQERGRYRRETETREQRNLFGKVTKREVTVKEEILILYGLSKTEFMATAAHELTHEMISERFPRADADRVPDWVEEGVCQYVAALVCRLLPGFEEELAAIENSPHAVYGDGYRRLKTRFGIANWAGVRQWMRTGDLR